MERNNGINYSFFKLRYSVDRKLYKYFSNVEYAIDSIKNRRIHMDNPTDFNDPFDAIISCPKLSDLPPQMSEIEYVHAFIDYISVANRVVDSNAKKDILNKLSNFAKTGCPGMSSEINRQESINDIIEKAYQNIPIESISIDTFVDLINNGFSGSKRSLHVDCKISCFSEIPDSILMWSYYARSHQGVCIEYNPTLLDTNIPINKKILESLTKVNYSPLRADVMESYDSSGDLNFLINKADVWHHENEWRIISTQEYEYLPFDCVTGVYLGVNFDTKAPKYNNIVKAVNTYSNLPIKQCKLSLLKYEIEFEEIYNSIYHTQLSELKELKVHSI